MACLVLVLLLLLLCTFDVFYYLRIVSTIFFGRLFQKKFKVTDTLTLYGFCFTQDLDLVFKHMNNARFVRDLDFARFHFYDRTGLYEEMVKRKTDALQAATNIRYRKVIPIFTFYRIETKMIYWEDRSVYLEHKFVTNDDFIRAIVLSKATMKEAPVDEVMEALEAGPRPELTKDLDFWIKSMEASSEKLKSDASSKKTD
ncbi:protein THEM6 [Cimex lectularius]|uniref:Protein THEM6 n=1 Tax=Cimex lectularius TaxID=79782 RepID=A0A8I6RW43_CIMLE|nr:protein THEM6 [Cimex lectularius]